jgi:hypothetical protein
MDEKKEIKVFPISFEVYAYDEREVEDLRMAIVAFIGYHARQGRAVTAEKAAKAIANWDKNPIVRNRICEYFK